MQREMLLTRQEAAEILKVSPRTLIRWAKVGIGPRPIDLKGGKGRRPAIRYPVSEVKKFIKEETSEF